MKRCAIFLALSVWVLMGAEPAHPTIEAHDTLRLGAGDGEIAKLVGYEPTPFTVTLEPVDSPHDYDPAYIVRFASPRPDAGASEAQNTVVLEWFPARRDGKKLEEAPAVLVLHPIDTRLFLGRGVARGLSELGVHGFLMHAPGYGMRENDPPRGWGDRFFERSAEAVADARRARDAIAALPGVAGGRVSVQGTSLGGFYAISAAGLDGAFEHAFIVAAGAKLEVVLTKGEREAAWLRESMRLHGVDEQEMRRRSGAFDAANFEARLPAGRTWLYSATHDQVVPRECTDALVRAAKLDAEHHTPIDADHYTILLRLPWIVERIAETLGGE